MKKLPSFEDRNVGRKPGIKRNNDQQLWLAQLHRPPKKSKSGNPPDQPDAWLLPKGLS